MLKTNGDRIPILNMYCGNQPVFICEKAVSNVNAAYERITVLCVNLVKENMNIVLHFTNVRSFFVYGSSDESPIAYVFFLLKNLPV